MAYVPNASIDAAARYTLPAMVFHWGLAVAIFCAFGAGVYLSGLPFSPAKIQLINWHKWAGVSILFLSVLRLLWRFTHRPPALPNRIELAMPGWQRLAHSGTHIALYVLFLAVPLLGWLSSSAKGFPIVWFGLIPLPDLVAPNPELAELIKPFHGWAAWALIGLVALHVAAALKHHFIDRDGLLDRMRPGR
jgi:cytochrome b561